MAIKLRLPWIKPHFLGPLEQVEPRSMTYLKFNFQSRFPDRTLPWFIEMICQNNIGVQLIDGSGLVSMIIVKLNFSHGLSLRVLASSTKTCHCSIELKNLALRHTWQGMNEKSTSQLYRIDRFTFNPPIQSNIFRPLELQSSSFPEPIRV